MSGPNPPTPSSQQPWRTPSSICNNWIAITPRSPDQGQLCEDLTQPCLLQTAPVTLRERSPGETDLFFWYFNLFHQIPHTKRQINQTSFLYIPSSFIPLTPLSFSRKMSCSVSCPCIYPVVYLLGNLAERRKVVFLAPRGDFDI